VCDGNCDLYADAYGDAHRYANTNSYSYSYGQTDASTAGSPNTRTTPVRGIGLQRSSVISRRVEDNTFHL